ncbi:MAG TPA: hypothetical protein VGV18_09520 [Verrucomicrobiae bacterium]|nr:hypothetical protein [Verrucomicrobiae bacterium]
MNRKIKNRVIIRRPTDDDCEASIGAASVAGTGIYAARQSAQLPSQIATLQPQQAPLTAQLQELQQERDDATNQLAALLSENSRFQSNSNELELLRLRAEVTRLENQADDSTAVAAKNLIDKANQLKQRLAETPGASIPEMQYLTDQDWLKAANSSLDTDLDYRKALASLWDIAEGRFATMLHDAPGRYMHANNQQFPTDLSQLQPYFTSSVDPDILDRWEITSPSTVPNIAVSSQGIITEKAAVDDIFDGRNVIGAGGYGSGDFLTTELEPYLDQITKAYRAANNGQPPSDISDVLPHATSPEQKTAVQKLVLKIQIRLKDNLCLFNLV